MTTGQTMLALGSLVLLGKLALSTNAMLLDADTVQKESEAIATATAIGQSMLEKIVVRGFDENCPGGVDTLTTSSLVAPLYLGVDTGELAGRDTTFNDIDDFDGFQDSIDTPRFGKYFVRCNVCYVSETAPYDSVGTATFLKRVDVSVANAFMTDPSDALKLPVPITVSRYIAYE